MSKYNHGIFAENCRKRAAEQVDAIPNSAADGEQTFTSSRPADHWTGSALPGGPMPVEAPIDYSQATRMPRHATPNRVFATDEERMEYVCTSHIGETAGRVTSHSTATLTEVQDAVFLWSCESLTAEQAMEMIVKALHA